MKRNFLISCILLPALLSGCGTVPAPVEPVPEITTSIAPVTEPVDTVPVSEPTEVFSADEPADSDFVRVLDYIPGILVELKYATSDNFLGRSIYDFQNVYLRYGTVKKLMSVQQELEEMGLRLKIWDGFRPISAQRMLWEACPDPRYVSNPDTGRCTHCRGNTIDLTLADAEGYSLEMPTGFDDFSSYADRDYSDCTEEAAKNAQLLQDLMEKYGFSGLDDEWWHYSDNTDYPVERTLDPALESRWYADCEEYISLRTEPDTAAEVITRIEKGEVVTLLGYDGSFALVTYGDRRGYVLSGYLSSVNKDEGNIGNDGVLNKPQYYADCQHFISLRTQADRTAEVITQIAAGEVFLVLEWEEDFALVDYHGLIGYVMSSYIKPV